MKQFVVTAIAILVFVGPVRGLICVNHVEPVRGIRGIAIEATGEQRQSTVLEGVTVTIQRGDFRATTITDTDGYFSLQAFRRATTTCAVLLRVSQRPTPQYRYARVPDPTLC